MSKTKRWELAYAGIFGERGVPVTAEDLAEVHETFAGRAPVTPGHTLADYLPALGFVTDLSYDPETTLLVGEKVELSDLIDEGFEKKMWGNWSVGVRTRKSDGKKYLHHVAVLGQVPPGIRDLKDLTGMPMINMADDADSEERWTFKLSDAAAYKIPMIGRILQGIRDYIIEKDGTDAADKVINTWEIDELKRMEETQTDSVMMADGEKRARGDGQGAKDKSQNKDKEDAQMADKDKDLELSDQKQKTATLEAALRASKKEALKKAAAGKLPEAFMPTLMNLADAQPVDDCIELSDGEGKKRNASPIDILTELFTAMALPVKPGTVDMGDLPGPDKELNSIADGIAAASPKK